MRSIIFLLGILGAPLALAAQGLETRESPHSVAATVDRLVNIVEQKGFRVFARVDHAKGAASVDLPLRPTQLLIFGNPKGGTLLMQQAQTAAIDLPLKYLVWETADGKVMVGWNSPAYLAQRHQLPPDMPVLGKMSKGLTGMAAAATAP